MSRVPPLSAAVLASLHPGRVRDASNTPTPTVRALDRVQAALDAHLAALAVLDRIEDAVVTAHGYPRVPLPKPVGGFAADTATIHRRLGRGPLARRLTRELRRRREAIAATADQAGIGPAREHEARTAQDLSDAAASLLLVPVEARSDLACKLAVLIAAGEQTQDDALAFPWLYLRALHADLIG